MIIKLKWLLRLNNVSIFSNYHFSFRRKRRAEIYEEYDNETIYRGNRKRRYVEDPKFDVFLNPEKKSQQKETLKNLTLKFQKVFKSMDMRTSYPGLFQVLW